MKFCLAFSPFLLCLDVEWIHTWLQSDSRSDRIRFHVVFHRFECVFQSLLFFGSDDTRMNAWLKHCSKSCGIDLIVVSHGRCAWKQRYARCATARAQGVLLDAAIILRQICALCNELTERVIIIIAIQVWSFDAGILRSLSLDCERAS